MPPVNMAEGTRKDISSVESAVLNLLVRVSCAARIFPFIERNAIGIERNAIGAAKAVDASRLAMMGEGKHHVSLDSVIETMLQISLDMSSKYGYVIQV